mgnify:CR=1 FL=1
MQIEPFKGLRFSRDIDIAKAISPPYDIIDDEMEKQFLKYEYNIAHLMRGTAFCAEKNPYDVAAQRLKAWIKRGTLTKDKTHSFYIYRQTAENTERNTLIALADPDDFLSKILPHEKLREKPLSDRMRLMEATRTSFGIVLLSVKDAEKRLSRIMAGVSGPVLSAELDSMRHELFMINGKDTIHRLREVLSDEKALILDGHHRSKSTVDFIRDSNLKAGVLVGIESREDNATKLTLTNKEAFKTQRPLEEIWAMAEKGIPAPPKSTYFTPKLYSGLVMYQLGGE